MEKKPYGPGLHGPNQSRFKSKMSVYKTQLFEKQKIRFQYNISERQMRNYYIKASTQHGNTGDNLIHLLECRLDAVTLRSGFAPTIYAARQAVGHGHILVNGKKVNIPSYQVKPNDVCDAFRQGQEDAGLHRRRFQRRRRDSRLHREERDRDDREACPPPQPRRGSHPRRGTARVEYYSR
jgi:ribosomal protein S4